MFGGMGHAGGPALAARAGGWKMPSGGMNASGCSTVTMLRREPLYTKLSAISAIFVSNASASELWYFTDTADPDAACNAYHVQAEALEDVLRILLDQGEDLHGIGRLGKAAESEERGALLDGFVGPCNFLLGSRQLHGQCLLHATCGGGLSIFGRHGETKNYGALRKTHTNKCMKFARGTRGVGDP